MSLISTVVMGALMLQTPTIQSVIPNNLQDIQFTVTVQNANQTELRKINQDFAQSYRFRTSEVQMKEPFMLRMRSQVDDMDIVFVVNGANRLVRIPRAGLNQRENLARSPGKRQTVLDFGILTPSLFRDLFRAEFVRTERNGQHVFDLRYNPSLNDGTRHRVWIDPNRRVMVRREWYSQIDGRLQAIFEYSEPRQFSGVWVNTRVTVFSADNNRAGTTTYTNVRVNQGIADSQFAIN